MEKIFERLKDAIYTVMESEFEDVFREYLDEFNSLYGTWPFSHERIEFQRLLDAMLDEVTRDIDVSLSTLEAEIDDKFRAENADGKEKA